MANLTRWNPTTGAVSLRDAMNRLLEDSVIFGAPDWFTNGWSNGGARYARLPMDVYVTDEHVVVTTAAPGVDPGEVDITFEGNALTIKGEAPAPVEGANYLLAERFHGSFSRTLQLDIPVDADQIEASFDNGLLTVTLPKAEVIKPRTIQVKAAR